MDICVFCSANEVEEKYVAAARELGKLIGDGKHTYIYGGSDSGLMKVIADTVEENGGTIVGVSFELLRDRVRKGNHKVIIEKNLAARKAKIISESDAFVVLPGGLGTLDEITEILELKKHQVHRKPIVIVNVDGFYQSLQEHLSRMEREGFLPKKLAEYLFFADTPQEAMRYIEAHGKN